MAEETVIVPSAVVLPEPPEDGPVSPSRGTKRRASSVSSSSSKIPKLDSSDTATSNSRTAPSRRTVIDADERKRGKRLFGGLLGALSQKPASTSQKRRVDIDQKQREKLRAQAEEEGVAKRQRFEKLTEARREEQKIWDRQALRTRQENKRSLARFLKTKTHPVLYYRPWELRPEEEDLIKQQIEEAETDDQHEPNDDQHNKGDDRQEDTKMDITELDGNHNEQPQADISHEGQVETSNHQETTANEVVPSTVPETASLDPSKDNPDETGEDVFQGDEDAVLY